MREAGTETRRGKADECYEGVRVSSAPSVQVKSRRRGTDATLSRVPPPWSGASQVQIMYLILHGGAGLHSKSNDHKLKSVLLDACSTLTSASSALDAVENAIRYLEDSTLLNAGPPPESASEISLCVGSGSNLTLHGTVECDAAIMDGLTRDFGSVGAVAGIKNPISLSRHVLQYSRTSDPLGRVPPLTLVSTGAHAFAPPTLRVSTDSMVCPRAKTQWETWTSRLAGSETEPKQEPDDAMLQDTVGAVAWDADSGATASGVSSGGILLKLPGRVGEAGIFGAGCWAQRRMACSVSGTGEYIIKASLARAVGAAFASDTDPDVHEIIRRVLADDFWIATQSASNPDPSAGVILLTVEEDEEGRERARMWCGFTTPSMAIAYASPSRPRGKAQILRRPQAVESRPANRPRIFVTALSL
ncbi:hypothetical protein MKEN_00692300 [Mycena kentingensis (nom. inval.)]|nr:hypothetical protein MKEN_00692300 [Mycena kentingensis (nom. inval.)]